MSRQRGPRTGYQARGPRRISIQSLFDAPLALQGNPQRHVVRRTGLSELAQRGFGTGKGHASAGSDEGRGPISTRDRGRAGASRVDWHGYAGEGQRPGVRVAVRDCGVTDEVLAVVRGS